MMRLLQSVCLCGLLMGLWSSVAFSATKQPNFVVIIADDLGANDVGIFGNPVIKTPNIDSLARAGMKFNHAFLVTASCTASRASIRTGLYPHSSGAPNLNQAIPADRKLLSSYLRDAGYYTASIGKWHIGDLVKSQFDLVLESQGDSGAEDWVNALSHRPMDKPFFFWLASHYPHVPYPKLLPSDPYKPADAIILPTFLDDEEARQGIAQYYTAIHRLDGEVGKVVQTLQAQGVLDDTYVIFLSDNGAPMPHAKTTLYDAGTKTPLIIRGPHLVPDKTVYRLVSSIDLAPTILTLAGIAAPVEMQGVPFLTRTAQLAGEKRQYVFSEQYNHGYHINRRAVRSVDYLYIRNFAENDNRCLLELQPMGKALVKAFHEGKLNPVQSLCFMDEVPVELYNLHDDARNLNNLAGVAAYADVQKQLDAILNAHAESTGDIDYLTQKNIPPFSARQMKKKLLSSEGR